MREKIKILKNLANFDLPTEELNRYIQAHCNPNYFANNNAGTSEFEQKSNQFKEDYCLYKNEYIMINMIKRDNKTNNIMKSKV